MAIYHFNAKLISRGLSTGVNAVAAAAYRSGSRLMCLRTGSTHNYCRKREVTSCSILAPANSPSWVYDRSQLWNTVESGETRKNSQLAREIVLGIPIELTSECRSKLLDGFVREAFVSLGMVADYAIHDKPGNPHAHIMLTLRELSPDGRGFTRTKNRNWNDPGLLETWRSLWSEHANRMLAQQGFAERIDHRSFADQGISGPTTVHVGRDNGANSDVVQERLDYNAYVHAQRELARIKKQEQLIQKQLLRITSAIIDLETTLAQALAERDRPTAQRTDTDSDSESTTGIVLPGDADFSVTPNRTRRPLRPRTTHKSTQPTHLQEDTSCSRY